MGLFRNLFGLQEREKISAPEKKPGRNEPCWCGSGKKYKKCHLGEDDRESTARSCSVNCGPT